MGFERGNDYQPGIAVLYLVALQLCSGWVPAKS